MPIALAVNNDTAIPNHETAATAWQEIKAADTFVKKALSEINASEKWVAIGARLYQLRKVLKRCNQWDKNTPGFEQAFADGRFGFSAKTGGKLATIGEVFGNGSSQYELAKLPASWDALYHLAANFKKHPEKLKLAIRDGKITSALSLRDVKELVGKRRTPPPTNTPKVTPMKNFDAKRNEYIKAAKILSPQECEQEILAIAKALHVDLRKFLEKKVAPNKAKLVWKKHKTIGNAFVAQDYEISRVSDLVSHKKTWTLLQGSDPDEEKRRCLAQGKTSKEEVIRLAEADYKNRIVKNQEA